MAICMDAEERRRERRDVGFELPPPPETEPPRAQGMEEDIPLTQLVEMEMDEIHREDALLAQEADPKKKSVLEDELSEGEFEQLVGCSDNTSMRKSARDRTRRKSLVRRKSITVIHSPYPSPTESPVSTPPRSPIPMSGPADEKEEEKEKKKSQD